MTSILGIMELTENKLKQRVQRNILTVSVLILVGKFIAYYLTNSVGVLTDAMERIVNVPMNEEVKARLDAELHCGRESSFRTWKN